MLLPYQNEPVTDFSVPANETAMLDALEKVKGELGQTYPLVIGGETIYRDDVFASVNPSRPDEVVGYFADATAEDVNRAVAVATEAFQTWQYVDVRERARYLLRAAAEMRRRKFEFDATMVLEVGKTWFEADADTSEAIDFLDYYARQMMELADSSNRLAPFPAEQLSLRYIPLGVGAIIPPWNFPNAIPSGMVGSTLVAGNTAVFKPAEQSPLIAYKMSQLFWKNGLPAGVLNFLTGPGDVVGGRMVDHPATRFINFTGSREVGTMIYERSAKVHPGQKWLKRCILEMGGKNAVVVDETAQIEAAAQGIIAGAFGFQGQKCSAGSRAILVRDIYDGVAERVVELASKLIVGAPDEGRHIDQGPVIDPDAMGKIMNYLELGTQEGKLLLGGERVPTPGNGYFIAPTIFGEVAGDARIAQEEIFGPVLALIPAKDYNEALEIANSTEYGLTGAVFSRDTARLERARHEFHVGNLYLNRKCTGAMVGVHPFGGFNMSGTDSKAGGPDYLTLFTQAKSVAERL